MYSEEQLQSEICKHNVQTIENCKKAMYSEETLLNVIDFIINNAQIEDRDLFINYQLLSSKQVLEEYKDRNNKTQTK